ncbi:MAG: 5'/3'-nucleotidase SurE, partial [Candidatus Microthrix parvicella]
MRIQVTNDDGISSEGLQELVRHLADTDHEIVVIAPDSDWSGAGTSLANSSDSYVNLGEIRSERVTIDGAEHVEAYAVAGAPAYTVVVARLGAFGPPPDLIVSGINAGANTGRAVLHSGTVGAALAGQNFGLSGLAVSAAETADDHPWYWSTAAALAVEMLDLLIEAPSRTVLNLNAPACDLDDCHGVRWARLAPFGTMRAAITTDDNDRQQFELRPSDAVPPPDTDVALLLEGFATITTVVGVTEAWADDSLDVQIDTDDLVPSVRPGADLQPVHRVPDASAPHTLRRPENVDDPTRAEVSGPHRHSHRHPTRGSDMTTASAPTDQGRRRFEDKVVFIT